MKKLSTYLMAITALMIISASAMAQDGTSPFVGSTHGYKVTAGSDTTVLLWEVIGGTGSDYTIVDGDTDSTSITWNTAGVYTVQFTETNSASTCLTVKTLDITVGENTFDVTISDSIIACNAADGVINFEGTDTITEISFTVDTVGVDWDHDWEIQFTIVSTATISDVSASAGDALTGDGNPGTPYVLTNILGTIPQVVITMKVTGNAFVQQSVAMEIVSATELKYLTGALLQENTNSTSLVNAIPNTSEITTD